MKMSHHAARIWLGSGLALLFQPFCGCRAPTDPPLYVSAYKGDFEAVKRALARGAHVDDPGAKVTPLFAAVLGDRKEVVDLLFAEGARLAVPTPEGPARSLLHYLAESRGVATGSSPDGHAATILAYDGPLGSEAREKALTWLTYLLKHAPDREDALRLSFNFEGSPLQTAARQSDVGAIERLLAAGADPTERHPAGSPFGRTPLFAALAEGQVDHVMALVGVSPPASPEDCQYLLVLRWVFRVHARERAFDVLEKLAAMRPGGNPDGACRLDWMQSFGKPEGAVEALRAAAARREDLGVRSGGASAAELAVWTRDKPALAWLAEHDPDTRFEAFRAAAEDAWLEVTAEGLTTLAPAMDVCEELIRHAAIRGHADILKAFSAARCPEHGPRWNDAMGHAKAEIGTLEVLFDAGADINAMSTNGSNALHAAARQGSRATVDWLLARGADLSIPVRAAVVDPSIKAMTAIELAETFNHNELAEYLRRRAEKR